MAGKYSIFDLGLDNFGRRPLELAYPEPQMQSVGALAFPGANELPAGQLSAGEMADILYSAKTSFTSTTAGYRWGKDLDGAYKFIIGTSIAALDYNITTDGVLTIRGTNVAGPIFNTIQESTSFIFVDQYNDAATAANIVFRKARGTYASPTVVLADDPLGFLGSTGYNSSSFPSTQNARITFSASENWTTTANGTYISFSVTASTTTTVSEVMRIINSGYVGIGTTTPISILSISGEAAHTFGTERLSVTSSNGYDFTIRVGGAASGATNRSGGTLLLQSGIATGSGSSIIELYTVTAGVAGTADRTPSVKMTIQGNGDIRLLSGMKLYPSADSVTALNIANTAQTSYVTFDTTNSRVGIGTESPDSNLDISSDGSVTSAYIQNFNATPDLRVSFFAGRGTAASPTQIQASDTLGIIDFLGYDNTPTNRRAARIDVIADGAAFTNSTSPGAIRFWTTPAGSVNVVERMRIENSGNIGISTSGITALFAIDQSSTTGAKPVLYLDQADISEEFIRFIGTSANAVLTQSIVEAADVAVATVQGYLKIFVSDEGNQLADQAYFIPIYTLA